mmetsp:Transcript_111004/g.312990  ORF Transcript_111004/g.312990 Transcript_111004/m.312990 type:complete len:348 (+) Transcript_111004:177-1220(+)
MPTAAYAWRAASASSGRDGPGKATKRSRRRHATVRLWASSAWWRNCATAAGGGNPRWHQSLPLAPMWLGRRAMSTQLSSIGTTPAKSTSPPLHTRHISSGAKGCSTESARITAPGASNPRSSARASSSLYSTPCEFSTNTSTQPDPRERNNSGSTCSPRPTESPMEPLRSAHSTTFSPAAAHNASQSKAATCAAALPRSLHAARTAAAPTPQPSSTTRSGEPSARPLCAKSRAASSAAPRAPAAKPRISPASMVSAASSNAKASPCLALSRSRPATPSSSLWPPRGEVCDGTARCEGSPNCFCKWLDNAVASLPKSLSAATASCGRSAAKARTAAALRAMARCGPAS